MTRVLHIARYTTAPVERRVALMASGQGFAFSLVRPRPIGGPYDGEAVRDRSVLSGVDAVRVWRVDNPHRSLYQTVGFGMRRVRPHLIHAEEEPDSVAALQVLTARVMFAPGARLVLNTCQNVNRRKRPWVEWALRRSLAAADAVVCRNAETSALRRELGYRRPTPVIPALTPDASIHRKRDVPRVSDAFTIACVGRLAPEKSLDTLVEAAAQLRSPVLLVLAGTGPCRAALAAQAERAGIGRATRFVGDLDLGQVADLFSAADVLVLPSRSTPVWKEQFGRVLIEAMGCELPVIGSDCGSIPTVLGGNGLVFPQNDTGALAAHLRRLRDSQELRRELGRRGYDYVTNEHTPEKRARETIDFYRQLLGDGAGVKG